MTTSPIKMDIDNEDEELNSVTYYLNKSNDNLMTMEDSYDHHQNVRCFQQYNRPQSSLKKLSQENLFSNI
jgi:hypothetical protein